MTDSISWSVHAVASTGAAVKTTGDTDVDAIFSARLTVPGTPQGSTPPDTSYKPQLDNTANVKFLALTSSTESLTVMTVPAGTVLTVAGALLLHGTAVALVVPDLSEILVSNSSTDDAELSILIGYDLD